MKKAKHPRSNGSGPLRLYKSYVFRNKDPVIDELRTIVERHFGHQMRGKDLREIAQDGGPSTSCMRAWFFGKTKRPQNPTVEAAGRAMGYQRVWRRMRGNQPEE